MRAVGAAKVFDGGAARARRQAQLSGEDAHDSPLYPRADGRHLVARDTLSHLVRDRGACRVRHGRAWPDPQGGGQDHLGARLGGQVRRGAHRRDRARGQARRDRLPHASGRAHRPGRALRARGAHLLRRARHLLQCSAGAGRRSADRRSRRLAGRAEETCDRAQDDADHRPQPRHSRRADHVRRQAGLCLCRVRPGQGPSRGRSQGGFDLRHLRRGRQLCQHRPAHRSLCGRQDGPDAGAGVDADHPARPPRHVLRHAGGDRLLAGAAGNRDPPPAAHGGAGGRGVLLARARRAPPPCRTSAIRC